MLPGERPKAWGCWETHTSSSQSQSQIILRYLAALLKAVFSQSRFMKDTVGSGRRC